MYIFTLANPKAKIKKLLSIIAVAALILAAIPFVSDIFGKEQSVENKSEGYPGEPIRVITDGSFESLSVWEAIINHYSF